MGIRVKGLVLWGMGLQGHMICKIENQWEKSLGNNVKLGLLRRDFGLVGNRNQGLSDWAFGSWDGNSGVC